MSRLLSGSALPAAMLCCGIASAGDVAVRHVDFVHQHDGRWTVSATLAHADTGWDHYADAWRVVAPDGTELGKRVLLHPHETEQPFTRSLADVRIPSGVGTVRVEAHDKVHGWSPDHVLVDLSRARGERYSVRR